MFPAARILLPLSLSTLVVIYKFFKSRRQSEFYEGDPPSDQSVPSPAPSDLESEILNWIRTHPAVLDRIRNRDPALLDEIRNFDPTVKIRNLDPACPSEFSVGVDVPLNRPSVPSPEPSAFEIFDEIQHFDPASLDEIRNFDPSIDEVRKLSLRKKEEKEKAEKERETEKENEKERESEKGEKGESSGRGGGNKNGGEVEKEVVEESSRRNHYPLRPDAGDCSYYLRTGICKFGWNCKFNHPRRRKNNQVSKNKAKQREEKQYQTGRKYNVCPGRRRRVPSLAPALELNFLGLPVRQGEKDCAYYMRNGTCKYETNCKFNHPDPTAAGEYRTQSAYGNGRPASLQGLPESQGIHSETTEWNGYQAPAYLPHRSMPAPPPYVMNNSVTETNFDRQYAQLKQVEELPERPGQLGCIYFAQTGDCNKSDCKYHHPKNETAATPSCA